MLQDEALEVFDKYWDRKGGKMIGKPVSANELAKVFGRQAEQDEFMKQLQEELNALKPGECLLYEAKPEASLLASLGLKLIVGAIKGLKSIQEENRVYVYREK